VPGPKPPLDPANLPATLGGPHGHLTVRNCRVVCGKSAACAVTEASDLTIEHCHLVAEEGVAVLWRSAPGGRLRVSGSVIEAAGAVWIAFPPARGADPDPGLVELTDNTMAVKGVCAFAYPGPPKHSVRVTARRNVMSTDSLFGVPTRAATAAGALDAFRAVVAGWTEAENVYPRKCNYVVAVRPVSMAVFPTRLTSLGDWLDFWQANGTGSVAGDIQFHPRAKADLPEPLRFDRVEQATGQVPSPVGAGDLGFD
jgi:hypothetical protein